MSMNKAYRISLEISPLCYMIGEFFSLSLSLSLSASGDKFPNDSNHSLQLFSSEREILPVDCLLVYARRAWKRADQRSASRIYQVLIIQSAMQQNANCLSRS